MCVSLLWNTFYISEVTSLHTRAPSSFKRGRAPEREAGPSQTCTKKQVRLTECVLVWCRVGLWAWIMHTYIWDNGFVCTEDAISETHTCHTVTEGKVLKIKLTSQYAQKKTERKAKTFQSSVSSLSQVWSFIYVSQVSLNSSHLWLESDLSQVMWFCVVVFNNTDL